MSCILVHGINDTSCSSWRWILSYPKNFRVGISRTKNPHDWMRQSEWKKVEHPYNKQYQLCLVSVIALGETYPKLCEVKQNLFGQKRKKWLTYLSVVTSNSHKEKQTPIDSKSRVIPLNYEQKFFSKIFNL